MFSKKHYNKIISLFLIATFLLMTLPAPSVLAKMVGTETLIMMDKAKEARENIQAILERKDVQSVMINQGVDPMEAKARIAALSDSEIIDLSNQLDQLPAGGDAVSTLIVAALIVFIVLLITDILGFTDIFSFVHKY